MGTIKTTNIEPIATNGTVTLGSSGDTFTVPSGVTVNMSSATQTGVGGANTPSFSAYDASNQTIPNTTYTLLEFDTKSFDTDSAYNTSTYKFTVPSGKGGKYLIGCAVKTTAATDRLILRLEKNDANTFYSETNTGTEAGSGQFNLLMDLSAGDHLKVAVYQNSGGNLNLEGGSGTNNFYGYKLI